MCVSTYRRSYAEWLFKVSVEEDDTYCQKRIKKMFLYLLSTFQNDDTNASFQIKGTAKDDF